MKNLSFELKHINAVHEIQCHGNFVTHHLLIVLRYNIRAYLLGRRIWILKYWHNVLWMLHITGICSRWFQTEWFGCNCRFTQYCMLTYRLIWQSFILHGNCTPNQYPVLWVISWTCHACRHVFCSYQTSKHLEWLWSAKLYLNAYLHTILPLGRKLCPENFISHCSVFLIYVVWKYCLWRTEVIISPKAAHMYTQSCLFGPWRR